jgi:sterol desaturase/sphingolipid hydroxylase (fatty acid hydroxylase superfamily)
MYGAKEEFSVMGLLQSMGTMDFALFVGAYYALYLFFAALLTAVAVFVFKVDYKGIESRQLRREVFLTLESTSTYAVCFWIILQAYNGWSATFDLREIFMAYALNSLIFTGWFYFSHRAWHRNRWVYKFVHASHHESVIVCPLTALANGWPESVWLSIGFFLGPLLFGAYASNVWGWYISIFSTVAETILGHSRIPFTLEHATHHALLNKNYGFYSLKNFHPNFDNLFGTWVYASESSRVRKFYPKEILNYTWNKETKHVNWEHVAGEKRK